MTTDFIQDLADRTAARGWAASHSSSSAPAIADTTAVSCVGLPTVRWRV